MGLGHAVCMGSEDTDHTVLQSSYPPSRRPWVEEGLLRRGASIRALLTEDSKSLAPGGRVGGLPWWLSGEESAGNVGVTKDTGSILGSERSPGRGHGSPLLYSCLENPTDRGAWWATVQSQTQLKRLSLHTWERGALKKVINLPIKTHHQSPYLSMSPSPQKQAAESSLHR